MRETIKQEAHKELVDLFKKIKCLNNNKPAKLDSEDLVFIGDISDAIAEYLNNVNDFNKATEQARKLLLFFENHSL